MKAQDPKKNVLVTLRLPRDLHAALRSRLDAEGRSAQKLFELTAVAYASGKLSWPSASPALERPR